MSYTIVGLFPSQENAKSVSESLEKTGFKNSDYIVYLNEQTKTEKPSLLNRLLYSSQEAVETVDSLITSVAIKSDDDLKKAKKSFNENGVVNIYEFQDMTLEEAKSLDYVKKVVELRAKSQIYAMPEISTSNSTVNTGINAEVSVGK